MALGRCRECGKEVSSEAKACPHCGASSPIKKKRGIWAMGCLGLLFVWIVGVVIGPIRPKHWIDRGSAEEALASCQTEMESRLKTPATADFTGVAESAVRTDDRGHWTVGSYVDAQNVFGAKLRTQFRCWASWSGGSHRVDSLHILP